MRKRLLGFCLLVFIVSINGIAQTPNTTQNTKVIGKLIEMLRNPNVTVQLRAAELLGRYGGEALDALEPLAEKTDSPNEELRRAATSAMNKILGIPENTSIAVTTVSTPTENSQKNNAATAKITGSNSLGTPDSLTKRTESLQTSSMVDEVSSEKSVKLSFAANKNDTCKHSVIVNGEPLGAQSGFYIVEVTNGGTPNSFNEQIQQYKGKPSKEQKIEVKLSEGENRIFIYPRIGNFESGTDRKELGANLVAFGEKCVEKSWIDEREVRILVGLEQLGASSAERKVNPFANLFFNIPVLSGSNKDGDLSKRELSLWSDIRLTTTPVQSFDALSTFSTSAFANNFLTTANTGKANDLVKSIDFMAGLEQILLPAERNFLRFKSLRTSVSFVAGGGATTPLSSRDSASFYKVPTVNNGSEINPDFLRAFPEVAGKKYVAFVAPDRDKFFRQYFAGLRFKTYQYDGEKRLDIMPSMFDVTFGQNEAITSKLTGVIMRLDGSMPLPIGRGDFLYLFGGVQMKLGKSVNRRLPSFFLEPVSGTGITELFSNETAVIPIDRSPYTISNRDVYRIGVGINFLKLFSPKKND